MASRLVEVAMQQVLGSPLPMPEHARSCVAGEAEEGLLKVVHATIRKVGEDVEKLRFNTAISQMMECANAFTSAEHVPHELFRSLLVLLNPFAPHLTEELWEQLDYPGSCLEEAWPSYDEALLVEQ